MKNQLVLDGINPRWNGNVFHMSDHMCFEFKEDALNLWSVDCVKTDDFFGNNDDMHVMMNPYSSI